MQLSHDGGAAYLELLYLQKELFTVVVELN